MTPIKPVAHLKFELETALAARAGVEGPSGDPLVTLMREANEREIARLEAELRSALASDLELTLDGAHVLQHTVAVPFLNRVLEGFQAAYRAIAKSQSTGTLPRSATTLSVAALSPGSFRLHVVTPPTQLELLDDAPAERAMVELIGLLAAAAAGTAASVAVDWAGRAPEAAVRSMIRLSATLAGGSGTTRIRWRGVEKDERLVAVSSDAARALVVALAGQSGQEVVTITGHLQMAQDQPPRVRIRTEEDDYIADVSSEDMLDLVRSLLFTDVTATLLVDMRTSPTTGKPITSTDLLQLDPAS